MDRNISPPAVAVGKERLPVSDPRDFGKSLGSIVSSAELDEWNRRREMPLHCLNPTARYPAKPSHDFPLQERTGTIGETGAKISN